MSQRFEKLTQQRVRLLFALFVIVVVVALFVIDPPTNVVLAPGLDSTP